MNRSPSALPEPSRTTIAAALNAVLADGQDFSSHTQVAHWNVRGPGFAALHPLFGELYKAISSQVDLVAERIVTLGGQAYGSARQAVKASRLPEYPAETVKDLEHVTLLAERLQLFLVGLRKARAVAAGEGDQDTVNLLTNVVEENEEWGWKLLATVS